MMLQWWGADGYFLVYFVFLPLVSFVVKKKHHKEHRGKKHKEHKE